MNDLELKVKLRELDYEEQELFLKRNGLLHKKIAKLKNLIKGLEKDGKNTTQKFDYITYGQMYMLVSKYLEEVGLDITASIDSKDNGEPFGKMLVVKIGGTITVTDTDTGYSKESKWFAEGYDYADKALTKAATFLMKSWLQANLFISSDKDPEEETLGGHTEEVDVEKEMMPLNKRYPYNPDKKLSTQLMELIRNKVISQNEVLSYMEGNKLTKVDDAVDKLTAYNEIVGG